jgi:hypothetical protein
MQALTDGSQEYMLQVGSDPGLAAIRLKVRNSEELTELEAEQWRQIRIARWVRMQNAYLQYHRGSIDDDGWSYYEQLICRADPAEWEQHKSGMLELFAAFVDSCLEQDQ